MKNLATIFFISYPLTGCSPSAPSQKEIEAAISTHFSQYGVEECNGISIENIVKKNGIKIGDSAYQIQTSFDIRIIPVEGFADSISELQIKMKDLETDQYRLSEEVDQVLKEEHRAYMNNAAILASNLEENSERTLPLVKQYIEVTQKASTTRDELGARTKAMRDTWGSDQCSRTTNLFRFSKKLNDLLITGETKSYELELSMIKTDNGWMLSE